MNRIRHLDRAWLLDAFQPPPDRPRSKVVALDDAIRTHVAPGMVLHFAYSEGRPMAASNALVRVFGGTSPALTVISSGLVSNQTALVTEGIVSRLIVSFVGENYPTPAPNPLLQAAIDSGAVEIENNSLLVLSQRLAAGAHGFPFALTRSLHGSSMADNPSYTRIADPFGSGEEIGAVEALVPDITIMHGLAADEAGNILMSPPFGESDIAAYAARKGVIATVERIVPAEDLRRHSSLVKIPADRVLSVSVAPFGCHPYAIYNPTDMDIPGYVEDARAFSDIRKAIRDEALFRQWTKDWIFDVSDHNAYLEKLGADRLDMLRGRACGDAWADGITQADLDRLAATTGHDAREMMVIAAARMVARKVREDGRRIVEAGVGFANLAAWLAVHRLQHEEGINAELVAEIGLYGYLPKPGEPFIFSNRNLPSTKSMAGVDSILGLQVGGRHNNCIAIIGSGQIDAAGNINSTLSGDGRYLLGSGGANDITSTAADVIAVSQQSRHRLVETLPYVTSPGARVSTLVTDLGVFEKRDGRLVLTQYFERAGEDRDTTLQHIRDRCGWELHVADDITPAGPPNSEDLLRLRLFDIRNDFLDYARPASEETT